MSNWQSLNEDVGEEWWEVAYKLFLESDPKAMILNHSELYMKADKWNDYGFRYDTLVPPTGTFRDVSKKAIVVVISRARRMNYHDWKNLDTPYSKSDVQDLEENDKKLINCVIDLIYKEDGSPRPFQRY